MGIVLDVSGESGVVMAKGRPVPLGKWRFKIESWTQCYMSSSGCGATASRRSVFTVAVDDLYRLDVIGESLFLLFHEDGVISINGIVEGANNTACVRCLGCGVPQLPPSLQAELNSKPELQQDAIAAAVEAERERIAKMLEDTRLFVGVENGFSVLPLADKVRNMGPDHANAK